MSQERLLWVNGALIPAGQAHIDARDRGFTLGDGLFETVRVHRGHPLGLDRHFARLRRSAAFLGITLSWRDHELRDAIAATLAANASTNAALRLTLGRGVPATRGLLPDPEATPSLVIDVQPFTGYPAELYSRGITAVTSQIPRNERSPLTRHKTLSYLDQVLVRREAAALGVDDALMRNTAGELVCASAANLFLVVGDDLVTPPINAGALPGTTRELILQRLAPGAGIGVVERGIHPAELSAASEAFLTSALLGVAPLTRVDERPVGDGLPGPRTRQLQAALGDWADAAGDE
ncbi:aminotransferase class IV [Nitrolancea hollandica]|uniref:aminotransferase class IV n=1 Tax=Nitrolancea hollandica TaxID=1206749 RepID=UPI0002EEED67|nr:aminotransferase class IV [Nitrolancea hollandica]